MSHGNIKVDSNLVKWQLEGTGFKIEDFDAKGFVAYGKKQIFWDRKDGIKLKTPSGKIEFKSSLLEDVGFESFPAYEHMFSPPEGQIRLTISIGYLSCFKKTAFGSF